MRLFYRYEFLRWLQHGFMIVGKDRDYDKYVRHYLTILRKQMQAHESMHSSKYKGSQKISEKNKNFGRKKTEFGKNCKMSKMQEKFSNFLIVSIYEYFNFVTYK